MARKKDNRKAFVIYENWVTILAGASDEITLQLIKAICNWKLGNEYEITDPTANAIFDSMLPKLEEDAGTYQNTCETNKRIAEERERNKRIQKESEREQSEHDGSTNVHERVTNDHLTNTNTNTNTNTEKKEKIKEKKRAVIPPTLDEVSAYIREKGYSVNAEQWWNYYNANGWHVGKNKMADWKASVRYWESKNKPTAKPASPTWDPNEDIYAKWRKRGSSDQGDVATG